MNNIARYDLPGARLVVESEKGWFVYYDDYLEQVIKIKESFNEVLKQLASVTEERNDILIKSKQVVEGIHRLQEQIESMEDVIDKLREREQDLSKELHKEKSKKDRAHRNEKKLKEEVERLLCVMENQSKEIASLDSGNVIHRKASIESVLNLQRTRSKGGVK